ncbi:MAG: type II secretion system F family protein, partial [Aggregatilineales bacterium]
MDPIMIFAGIAGLLILVAAMVYVAYRDDDNRDALNDRLALYSEQDVIVDSLEDVEQKLPFRDRVLIPIVRWLSNLVARATPQQQLETTRKMLDMAGMTTDPTQFFLLRIGATIALGFMGFMVGFVITQQPLMNALGFTGGGILLGYMFPVMSVKSKIKKRQDNILKALPDALDLLVICVEAGLGFDAAMGKVYEKWENELALAFGRVLREIQLGKLRRDALRDMAERMDVPDVNSFTAAIIQAEQLGVSMAKILRVQSD